MKQLWECDDCGEVVESDPHAHSDHGGVIKVYGPSCRECEQPMRPIPGRLEGCYIIEDAEGQ